MPTPSGHTTAIAATKVIGADIKDAKGKKIGHVEDIVLDKTSNQILFAVAGFGGVMGMGEKYHPVPWALLDYRPDEKAYYVSISEDQLKAAPADSIDQLTAADGAVTRDSANAYYGVA
jgi:sporulation protein YlmC with PRC-barrel domain